MGFFFALAVIAMLLSCKKEIHEESSFVSSQKAIQELKVWYAKVPLAEKSTTVQVNGKATEAAEIPDWNAAKYFSDGSITVAPVKLGKLKPGALTFKWLVAKNSSNGEITDVNYYRVFEGKEKPTTNSRELKNVSFISRLIIGKQAPKDFTGVVLKYTDKNLLLVTTRYENGIVTNVKEHSTRSEEVPESVAPVECSSYIVDSWWVTYCNGVVVSVEYLYSTTYSNCPGEGGGGNNPFYILYDLEDDFAYTCPDNFTFTGITTNNLW